MDRRTFLKSSGVAAAATATGTATMQQAAAAPARHEARIEIATALSPQFQSGYLRDRADRFALSLRNLSQGRIKLNFVATEQSGGQAVSSGELAAYFGTEAEHMDLEPGLGFFSGLPGDLGLSADDFKSWLTAGGGQMHWDTLSAERGIKSFAVGHSGRTQGLWSRTDIVLLEQIKGRSLLASGLSARVGERLGFELTADPEAADAIEIPTGVTAALADHKIGHSQFWFTDGITPSGQVLSFGLNRSNWDRLADSDKAIIETCASEAFHQYISETTAHDRAVAPTLLAHRGIERRQWQDEIRRAIAHVAAQVVEDIAESSQSSRDLYENYMFFRQTVTGETGIGNSVGLV